METVWKFALETIDDQYIDMPVGAKILCVQTQGNKPCLWARVDSESKFRLRRFRVVGTGDSLPNIPMDYIGTYQLYSGQCVFHVFEQTQ